MDKNQTVLITGASSGIGKCLAHCFARNQFDLVLVARQTEKLKSIAQELRQQYGNKVLISVNDLNDPKAPEKLFQDLASRNMQIQVLVNNAGFGEYGFFEEISLEKELSMMQVNMVAVVHLTKLFLKQLPKGQPGKILNVASTAAFQPGPLMSVYFATKAFVLSFSEALANELATRKVTVTALCPGPTQTEFEQRANLEGSPLFARGAASASDVAAAGFEALMAGKIIAIPGHKNKLLAFATRFAPRKLVTKLVRTFQEKK